MQNLAALINHLPWNVVIGACLTIGLAPLVPEPHVWENLKMLASGTLSRPTDIFDLILHGAPFLVAVAKLVVGRQHVVDSWQRPSRFGYGASSNSV